MNRRSNSSGDTQNKSFTRLILLVAGAAGILLVGFLITAKFGAITGEEFCPDTFARREFYYHEIPLLGVQITPVTRTDTTNSLESMLRTDKYVTPQAGGSLRWDLVYDARSTQTTSKGDAAILCKYLDATDSNGDFYWQTWTKDHPKIAKVMWPAVAAVARQQLYIFVPELIELAKTADDATKLKSDIDRLLAERYADLASTHQKMDDHATAVKLFDYAIQRAADDEKLLHRRAFSAQQLDNSEAPPTETDSKAPRED